MASEVRVQDRAAPLAVVRRGVHSQSEEAYLRIRDRILTLDLPPGSLVHEARLREELAIGRTPIREALQRLAHEKLVRSVPVARDTRESIASTLTFKQHYAIDLLAGLALTVVAYFIFFRWSRVELHADTSDADRAGNASPHADADGA